MPNILAPDRRNYLRGTAAVRFQADGTTGYYDLGNIADFQLQAVAKSIAEHKASRAGTLQVDRRESAELQLGFNIAIEDFNTAGLAILLQANAATAFSQASATAATTSLATPPQDLWLDIGAYRILNVSVKVGVTVKAIDTDYIIDPLFGQILFPSATTTILTTDTVTVTYDKPVISGDILMPLSKTKQLHGLAKINFLASDGRIQQWIPWGVDIVINGQTNLSPSDTSFAKATGELLFTPDFKKSSPYGQLITLP